MTGTNRQGTDFGFESTAAQVIKGTDLHGRRAIVTGGSSGIGVETARVLAMAGAEVTLAVRDITAGERTANQIDHDVKVVHSDLADQDSVEGFVRNWDGPLHVLVNNAGVMACDETRTRQGSELQFATNHLGHFALTTGLHPWLAAEGARVVCVSSSDHLISDVHLDDLQLIARPYDRWTDYGQSKTTNILFAIEANRRWSADGITANALHPGRIPTNSALHLGPAQVAAVTGAGTRPDRLKTIEEGAATSVFVATSPLLKGIGGRYFEDCNEGVPHGDGSRTGYAPYALDLESAAALWHTSTRLVEEAR